MIGIVIVSHSAKLAEGVAELAAQAAQSGGVRFATAGGTGDETNPIGTDAFRVLDAIESVYSDDGVLVFMDLGSAVLSAETALELLDEVRRGRVRLCRGPVVEGAVGAASLAAAGAGVDEICRGEPAPQLKLALHERRVILTNRLGLHARPAARFIRIARRFDGRVTVENVTTTKGPVDAASLNGLLSLGARQGHTLVVRSNSESALDALARFIESGCGDRDGEAQRESAVRAEAGELHGIPASVGIAIGPLVRTRTAQIEVPRQTAPDSDAEWRRLEPAIAAARDEIPRGGEHAGILDAHLLFLEDPQLLDRAREIIAAENRDAASAWYDASHEFTTRLAALEDSYLKARAADLADAAGRVLRRLTGASGAAFRLDAPSIVAAHDLLPSEAANLDPALVLGLCLESGSASAHSAILVRARGIPCVVGLGPALAAVPDGTTVAIDGERGAVRVSPSDGEIETVGQRRHAWLGARNAARANRKRPAATRDGRRISVLANLSRDTEVVDAIENGAEGVGVLRTEFLFLHRKTPPTEQEQYEAYRAIADALEGRPLVIRTLDIGGDKAAPYIAPGEEANPFLGWRGVRISLDRRDLFETQLRAIQRAGHERPVEVLLPMISTVAELREAKRAVAAVEKQLRNDGIACGVNIPVGVMIEVPAAAATATELAARSARLSIGTNDLVQYMMAADRTNSRVAPLADYFQPAVVRTIRDVAEAGRRAGIRVDVCGEMGADPLAIPLLIGLGIEEVSVSASLIPEVKRGIATLTLSECETVANRALAAESNDEIRHMLAEVTSRI